MQNATIGRIVHILLDPAQNNGSDVAAAVIARVWNEPCAPGPLPIEQQTVNVRVLGDSAETLHLTSILLFDHRPADEDLAVLNAQNPKGYRAVAFWPPRV